ncbi:hypothetical protein, partial [Escherichia coli]|uniref:hypothetical protein n=1 Tax=Escherichia coli TaxID=562 RepID=UPI001EDACF7A|nr:hypothetical protein [Escherichia coli]
KPALVDLPSVDTTAIHGNLIYANTTNGPATVNLETPETEPQVWANYRTEDPAPVLVTNDAVYVVATQLESTTVYRADRQR